MTAAVTTTNGGAAPRGAAPSPTAAPSMLAQVAALWSLDTPGLRAKYQEVFGEPTRSRNKTWLFRACAYRVQELAEGGLSERAKRRAAELARESDVRPRRTADAPTGGAAPRGPTRVLGVEPVRDPGLPLPGAVLVRAYRGRQIRVRILDDGGFEYESRVFRSLTAVAEAVTGAHWNGRAFFGIAAPRREEPASR